MALYRQLNGALEESSLASQRFLPPDILGHKITKQTVRDELHWRIRFLQRGLSSKIAEKAKNIFAILVLIGEPQAIKELLSEKVTDDDLPFSRASSDDDGILLSSRKRILRSFVGWKNPATIDSFLEKQWVVLSPVLDSAVQHEKIDKNRPLPVLGKKEVGRSTSSIVYKSAIHSAYRKDSIGNLEIAIKEINDYNLFFKELKILQQIHDINNPHLIQFLTTWEYREAYYILFPWANGGNLRDLWKHRTLAQLDRKPIYWSLKQMLGLSSALRDLYDKNCRHGDLKPENILYFSQQDQNYLVIADVGVSKIHNQATKLRNEGTSTKATTPSYEPPEVLLHQDSNTPRSRKYDIWSLGCIFLEFLIWISSGFEEIKKLHESVSDPAYCFYELGEDGKPHIRPFLIEKMEKLRQHSRFKGTSVEALVNLIAEHLLLVEADDRYKPEDLYTELKRIVHDAENID